MESVIVPALFVGGAVYVLSRPSGPVLQPGDIGYRDPRSGATIGDISNGVPDGNYSNDPWLSDGGQSGFNLDGRLADPAARQKLDLLNAAMGKAYEGLSSAAKSSAADQLNTQLNLDPPLRGNETWDTVARIAGGAAASAGCDAIPGIGAAVSPLCAMAGAYLGVQLEQWMASELPGLQSWVNDNLGGVVGAISDQLSDWWHSIF